MSLSYCSPPDRWHLLDTQTWDLLGAPSSCRRLESKSSNAHQPQSVLGQDVGGLPVSPNIDKVELFFLELLLHPFETDILGLVGIPHSRRISGAHDSD